MKVSVIIPFFNVGERLETAVQSALDQIETGEVLLIDDGSTDNSPEIALVLSIKSTKVKLFQLKHNAGPSTARNLGITNAKYPIIAFLDADDIYRPDRFTESVHMLAQAEVNPPDAVFGVTENAFESEELRRKYEVIYGKETDMIYFKPFKTHDQFFKALALGKEGSIHLNAITVKKEILVSMGGFDESLRQMEDTDLILRLAKYGTLNAQKSIEPLSTRFIHGKNLVLSRNDQEKRRLIFLRKWIYVSLQNRYSLPIFLHFLRSYLGEHPFSGRGVFSPLKTIFLKLILLFQLIKSYKYHVTKT